MLQLKKELNVLCQTSHEWTVLLQEVLVDFDCKQAATDPMLYI